MPEEKFWYKIIKKIAASFLVAFLTLSFFVGAHFALAQEIPPAVRQTIALENNAEEGPAWEQSSLVTFGLKFMVRGKEALAWVMGIEDGGFENPAIQSSYKTVLTIVNSLFILGLLGIAVLWMFSLVIPRHQIKRVILVYVFAVIFVNFAFPFTRLLVDATNVLQRTMLTRNGNPIGVVDIVNTPAYTEAIGFESKTGRTLKNTTENLSLNVGSAAGSSVPFGRMTPDAASTLIGGTLSGVSSGNIDLQMQSPPPARLELNANQPLNVTLTSEKYFNPRQEQTWFSFALMILTGLAYLGIGLVFLLRLVILWVLLIVSPILLLFAIFNVTRGYFYNWLALYGRWMLIGPLVALGIAAMVNIWQTVGLPLTSAYDSSAAAQGFGATTNVRFMLPGGRIANSLSSTREMMEYILFLMMLYLPLFFGFALTRQKRWQSAFAWVTENKTRSEKSEKSTVKAEETPRVQGSTEFTKGWMGNVKDFLNHQVSKVTQTALPPSGRSLREMPGSPLPSAASFLPHELTLMEMPQMLGLLGASSESRHSREEVVTKLAAPEMLADPAEQKKATAVREEIEKRAERGDLEAILVKQEIETQGMNTPGSAPEVNVNVSGIQSAPMNADSVKEPSPPPAAPITKPPEEPLSVNPILEEEEAAEEAEANRDNIKKNE